VTNFLRYQCLHLEVCEKVTMADPLLSPRAHTEDKRFEPKQKVELSEPKDDAYTYEQLAECDGKASP
jgi:hypothetical protein